MTFQTKKTLLMPNQHLRICRSMRLMTTHTALQAHRRMLKGERTPFVGMALDARRFITEGSFHLPGLQPTVGLVAVNATDCSFVKLMPIGLGKSTLNFLVTTETEQVGLVRQQMQRLLGCVNAMAIRAGNLIPSVQAVRTACMGLRPSVAGKTLPVHFFDGQAFEGKDLRSITRIDVGFTRSMARLTTLVFPAFGTAGLEHLVGILSERLGQVFVAGGTGGGSHVLVLG
jgi:hypothetical protein